MTNDVRILKVEGLSKTYGQAHAKTVALDAMSFDVLGGEFLGIMGPSGSGKTTLLNCIATMIRPSDGRIVVNGVDLATLKGATLAAHRGQVVGYLFQEFELLEHMTARENILLPYTLHGGKAEPGQARCLDLAQRLAIEDLLDKFPAQLSGGEKQRVAAARALITQPSVLLADEPTGALDSKSARTLMELLSALHETEKRTIVMVTHDPVIASYCSRILFIQDGRLFHELRRQGPTEALDVFYERILTVLTSLGGGLQHAF
ncbi:ABC transporter, ATP-binding protein [Clostridiaceae bacterium JG1575]|nr:ABC transporter, ATP-binding protein [Clostridiaceae bacterium JG1575]